MRIVTIGVAATVWAVTGAAAQQASHPAVDTLFSRFGGPDSPGCALGIVRDGHLVYERGYGMGNLDYGFPNGPSAVYGLASVSKQFTAALIALLVEEGRIRLDDDIRTYLPEMPDYGRRITIDHLVHHTAGLRDYTNIGWFAGLPDESANPEIFRLITRQKKLLTPPGQRYHYDSSDYLLLSVIVERVTGRPFREVAADRLFRPLDMNDTHVHDDPGHPMKNRAIPYRVDSAGAVHVSMKADAADKGGTGVYSTIRDLAKWDANFYSRKVGGDTFHTLMHRRGVLNSGDTIDYAFGNIVASWRGLSRVEHSGRNYEGGISNDLLRFPEQNFSVILLCNVHVNPVVVARDVADVFLSDRYTEPAPPRPGPRPSPPPVSTSRIKLPASATALAGRYYSQELDVLYTAGFENGQLVVSARNVPATAFDPATGDRFVSGGDCGILFERDRAGQGLAFTLECGDANGIRFTRVPLR